VTGYGRDDLYSIPARDEDIFVGFEILTSVTVKNNIFWYMKPYNL
jgi:hypothetical protein